jgi:AcrR family transcriptional regulator
MDDPRIRKTRQALFQALACLLQEKEFERITVSDIIREAHVTRKTFYNHYQDKIDMVQEYQALLSQEILALQAAHTALGYDYFVDLLTLLKRKGSLLRGLMSARGSPAVQEILKGTMAEYCRRQLAGGSETAVFQTYQSVMMANAIFGMVQYWLTAKPQLSPQEAAGILCRLRFPSE